MSSKLKKSREKTLQGIDHKAYLERITKTLYYGKLGKSDGLSLPVTELAAELFSESHRGRTLQRLHINDAANISRNACISPCSLILAMLYLEKLKKCNPEYLEKTSPSDLFLVSLMISSKFLFDDGEWDEVFMDEWSSSGDMSSKELAKLERDFLAAIDWRVFVNQEEFWKKLNDIECLVAEKQGKQRGFYTYTELHNLLKFIELQSLLNCIVALSVILAATYTACVLTMVYGSLYVTSGLSHHVAITTDQCTNVAISSSQDVAKPMTDHAKTRPNSTNIHAVNVIKTGLLLASINSLLDPNYCHQNCTEYETAKTQKYDWWNVPSMIWLTKTSQLAEQLASNVVFNHLDFGYLKYLCEVLFVKQVDLQLDITVNKATRTRIQDQLEQNWHEEWTQSIRNEKPTFLYYITNVKA